MPFNIISYKKAIWKGIEGHLKGIVQKLEDSQLVNQNSEHLCVCCAHNSKSAPSIPAFIDCLFFGIQQSQQHLKK